jgi:hypothetical protein
MEPYVEPVVEIITFETEDVITTSSDTDFLGDLEDCEVPPLF